MRANGIEFVGDVCFTKPEIQRFRLVNGNRTDPRVWVAVHSDCQGATYGNWGESDAPLGHWFSDSPKFVTHVERVRKIKESLVAEQQRLKQAKANRAASYGQCLEKSDRWVQAPANHPYLVKKQLSNRGVFWCDSELLFPMNDVNGYFKTFHRILPDGSKKLSWALSPKGAFIQLGETITSPIRICEGWATGKAIEAAVGGTVLCAIPCGNVPDVTAAVAAEYPNMDIILCPDNDQWKAKEIDPRTKKRKKNSGLYYAGIASRIDNFSICAPSFEHCDVSSQPTDWHDLLMLAGIKETRKQLLAVSK